MIEFGPPIEVNGVRPEWLKDDDRVKWSWDGEVFIHHTDAESLNWSGTIRQPKPVTHIKLVSTHPHYTKDTAMTDDEIIAKGFKPWHGGDTAPADYEDSPRKGSAVLMRDGTISRIGGSWFWKNSGSPGNIIGYHPKEPTKPTRIVIPDGPAPEWAVKRWSELYTNTYDGAWAVAAHLVAMLEQPPVDEVLMKAREILEAAKGADTDGVITANFLSGDYDDQFCMRAVMAALRVAGQEMGKGEV